MGWADWSLKSGTCPPQRHEYSVRTLPVSSVILQAGEVGNCGFLFTTKCVCVCMCVNACHFEKFQTLCSSFFLTRVSACVKL